MDKITVVCHKDHDKGYEDYVGKCLLCEVERLQKREWVGLTVEEIHNIWLHMSGKSEGLLEAGGKADFPVLFANAILEYNKREWVGLTDEDKHYLNEVLNLQGRFPVIDAIEAKLKEKNNG